MIRFAWGASIILLLTVGLAANGMRTQSRTDYSDGEVAKEILKGVQNELDLVEGDVKVVLVVDARCGRCEQVIHQEVAKERMLLIVSLNSSLSDATIDRASALGHKVMRLDAEDRLVCVPAKIHFFRSQVDSFECL